MQNMCSVSHQLNVAGRAVDTLPVLDRPLEHIAKFSLCAQVVGPHEINHAPILDQVVLQGVAGQHHPALCLHTFEGVRDGGVAVFNSVSLVADHQVRTRLDQRIVDFCKSGHLYFLKHTKIGLRTTPQGFFSIALVLDVDQADEFLFLA